MMTLIATTGAMIGVSPLMIYYFGRLYPYSFVSNPLALPVVSLLLPSSLFLNFLSLVFRHWNLLSPILSVNVFLARCLIALTSVFPEFDAVIPRPSPITLVIYYVALYCLFNFYQRKSTDTGNNISEPNLQSENTER
jgi:hypothetical protein